MTSFGYPDWQRYAQWFGQPLFQNAALAIGAGSHTDGPIVVANYSSVVLALKPTGGTITATVKQSLHGAPSALVLSEQFIVPAGSTLFEAIVLLGNVVELDLQGSAGGETVAYALVPTNTSSNAQVITQATVNIQHGGVLVAAEPTIDFVDGVGVGFTVTDDAPNTRVIVTPTLSPLADVTLVAPAASIDFTSIPQTVSHLMVVAYLREDAAVGFDALFLRLNNDSGANYDYQRVTSSNSSTLAAAGATGQTSARCGILPGASASANRFGAARILIPHYANAANDKVLEASSGALDSVAANCLTETGAAGWRSAAAVNRVTLLPGAGNFIAGSRATLYGLA